ncbi:MAG: histidine kinase [Cyclobacteriaceae bacterium]
MKIKKELTSILSIFLIGGLVQSLIFCRECFQNPTELASVWTYSGSLWVLLWKGSEYSVVLLDKWVTWFEAPLTRVVVAFISTTLYSGSVFYILTISFQVFSWGREYDQVVENFTLMDLIPVVITTLVINTFMHGRAFLLGWRQEVINTERIKTEQVATQFKSLRNQVNPHFLFNSLNALTSLVYDDQEKAVAFIQKLSQVYRYVLDQTDNEVATLAEELNFVQSFVYLQQIRFGSNLQFKFDCNGQQDRYVLPVSIQMLIENAIKHNIIDADHPMSIEIACDEQYVTVTNSLNVKKSLDSTGIGLENLRARYEHLSKLSMVIDKTEKSFVVKLPLLKFE